MALCFVGLGYSVYLADISRHHQRLPLLTVPLICPSSSKQLMSGSLLLSSLKSHVPTTAPPVPLTRVQACKFGLRRDHPDDKELWTGEGGGHCEPEERSRAPTLQVELRDTAGALLLQGAQQDPSQAFQHPPVVQGPHGTV